MGHLCVPASELAKMIWEVLACFQADVLVIDGKIRVCSDGKTGTT
jgi:hypothetical protein